MKFGWMLGVLVLPYSALFAPGPAGNPNGDAYFGQPGGVYDSAANPPRNNGSVAYDPNAPLPKPAAPATPGGSAPTP